MDDDRHILTQWLALEETKTIQGESVTKASQEDRAAIRRVLYEILCVLLEDQEMITKYACFYLANSLLWSCRVKDAALLQLFFDLFDRLLHKEGMSTFFIESMTGFSHISLDIPEDLILDKSSQQAAQPAEPLTVETITEGIPEKPKEDLNGGRSDAL